MSAAREKTTPTGGRGARRRQETRAKLIRAAHAVMARKGIDATTLQEITDEADVAFGSFYNHFASKEAIVEAIASETIESFGEALDWMVDSVDDPVEVLSLSVRYTLARAAEDETWAWFLVRCGLSMPVFQVGLVWRMRRDIAIVVDAGRCDVTDVDYTVLAAAGAIMAIMMARLRGEIGDDAPERAAATVLRLLGLSAEDALEIANRPLPDVRRPTADGSVR